MSVINPRQNTNNASRYLGVCSPYTLKLSRSTGKLLGLPAPEYLRVGRSIAYETEKLDAWIERHASRQSNTTQNRTEIRNQR